MTSTFCGEEVFGRFWFVIVATDAKFFCIGGKVKVVKWLVVKWLVALRV